MENQKKDTTLNQNKGSQQQQAPSNRTDNYSQQGTSTGNRDKQTDPSDRLADRSRSQQTSNDQDQNER